MMPSPFFFLAPFMLLLAGKGKSMSKASVAGPFIDSLPNHWGPQREEMIRNEMARKIRENDWDESNIGWTTVLSRRGDLVASIPVMADSLRLDGIRINTDFRTGQVLADMLGVYQLTPYVADLINAQAGYWTWPTNQLWQGGGTDNSGSETRRMIDHSRIVDERFAKAQLRANGNPFLKNNPAKFWVNTSRNWEKGQKYGANYGMYDAKGGMIQGPIPGLTHGLDHVDYSQVFWAMGPKAAVSSLSNAFVPVEVSLSVMVDMPDLKPLIAGNDNLPELRHPGIPKATSNV